MAITLLAVDNNVLQHIQAEGVVFHHCLMKKKVLLCLVIFGFQVGGMISRSFIPWENHRIIKSTQSPIESYLKCIAFEINAFHFTTTLFLFA